MTGAAPDARHDGKPKPHFEGEFVKKRGDGPKWQTVRLEDGTSVGAEK